MTGPRTVGAHANVADMPVTPPQDHSDNWWVYFEVSAPHLTPKITLHCGECGFVLYSSQVTDTNTNREPVQIGFGNLRERVRDHINELHPGGRP